MTLRRFGPFIALLTLFAARPICAQTAGSPLTDRFSVSLGGFLLNTSTSVRVDGLARSGSTIDLERDLGFNDTDRVRVDAYWRFKRRHKIRLMYFNTQQVRERSIDREIEFRDTTFVVDADLRSEFKTAVAEVAYEYAFVQRPNYEIAATAGVHNVEFGLELSAASASRSTDVSNSARADGPLPVIGLRGVWQLSDRWYADAQGQFFRTRIAPYDGRLEDYNASIVWQAFKHVGLGVGYNEFVAKADVDGSRFDGHIRWRYGGARLFLTASF